MTKIPIELDELMWTLAETGEQAAIDEFCVRHPECADEVRKRSTMVAGLKGSRPRSARKRANERFMPSARAIHPNVPRWGGVAAGTLVLAGIVVATVGTVRYLDARDKALDQASTPAATKGFEQEPTYVQAGGQPSRQTEPASPGGSQNTAPQPVPVLESAFDRPVTIVSKNASLSACLNDIALQAGIKLESAPGMPETQIELDYRDTPAISVLQDMGRIFGFSVLRQNPTTALLIPAVDPKSKASAPAPAGTSGPVGPVEPSGSGLQPVGGGTSSDRTGN